MFVLMSGKKTGDYVAVLEALKEMVPSTETNLKTVTVDFEKAIWKAVGEVYPEAEIFGCNFHFTQAIWKRIHAKGLAPAYWKGGKRYDYMAKLLKLPFLPHEHIQEAFEHLRSHAPSGRAYQDHLSKNFFFSVDIA